jgi:hypothetical protein
MANNNKQNQNTTLQPQKMPQPEIQPLRALAKVLIQVAESLQPASKIREVIRDVIPTNKDEAQIFANQVERMGLAMEAAKSGVLAERVARELI